MPCFRPARRLRPCLRPSRRLRHCLRPSLRPSSSSPPPPLARRCELDDYWFDQGTGGDYEGVETWLPPLGGDVFPSAFDWLRLPTSLYHAMVAVNNTYRGGASRATGEPYVWKTDDLYALPQVKNPAHKTY